MTADLTAILADLVRDDLAVRESDGCRVLLVDGEVVARVAKTPDVCADLIRLRVKFAWETLLVSHYLNGSEGEA